jgi:hypothetical protein
MTKASAACAWLPSVGILGTGVAMGVANRICSFT